MPHPLSQKLTFENLQSELINRVDKKFESLRSSRQGLERNWVKIHRAVTEGDFLNSSLTDLVGNYIDLKDNSYASLVNQSIAQKLSIINPKGFAFDPKSASAGVADQKVIEAVEEYFKQKYSHEECNWSGSWHDAIYQNETFNCGVLHYSFAFKTEPKANENYSVVNGAIQLDSYSEEHELVYQGPKLTFVNLFNFYIDNQSFNFSDLYKQDTYYREAVNFIHVKEDIRFDPSKPYINEARVLFRDNAALKLLESVSYTQSSAEKDLNKPQASIDSGPSNTQAIKNFIEVRTCYLDSLRLTVDGGEQVNLNNVCFIYAIQDGSRIPLLLEFNPLPFNQKPYIYLPGFKNGVDFYSSSSAGRAYSQYSLSAFNTALEAKTAGDAVFGSELIDLGLVTHFAGAQNEFIDMWKKPGAKEFVDLSEFKKEGGDPNQTFISPQRQRAIELLPLLRNQKETAKQAQSEAIQEISAPDLTKSTASAVRYNATQKDLFSQHFETIAKDAFTRIIKLTIADFKRLACCLQPEMIVSGVDKPQMESLLNDMKEGKAAKLDDGTAYQYEMAKTPQGQVPMVTAYNLYTKKKMVQLSSFFFQGLDVAININLDVDQNYKAFMDEQYGRILDLSKELQIPELGLFAVESIANLHDLPGTDKMVEMLENKINQMNQPDPNAEAQTQAQMITAQANAAQKEASAQHLAAQAAKTGQEVQANQAAMQMVGV